MTLFWILIALLVLCVLIVVHEWGHFLAGRLLGFAIDEFSVGFGPALYSRKSKKGTRFSLRAIPLGGYCRFLGEDEEGEDKKEGAFSDQAAWKRLIVQASGAIFNIVLAFLLSIILFAWLGTARPQIYSVDPQKPAGTAGVLPGDEILMVNGKDVDYQNVTDSIQEATSGDAPMELVLNREGEEVEVVLDSEYDPSSGRRMIGVTIGGGTPLRLGPGAVINHAASATGNSATEILKALGNLFVNPQSMAQNMAGPVGTVAMMGEGLSESFSDPSTQGVNWKAGFSMLLNLAVLLSVNLGVFNLLPLPALDGGRLVFTLIEMVVRKPVPKRIEGVIHMAGILLLLGLSIFFAFNDISRLAGG